MEHSRSSSESAGWLSRFSNYMKERRYRRMWNALHKVFTRAKERDGIKTSFTLHSARHCYATHLLEAGTDLRYIQELLRHKHSTTTEIYTHVGTRNIQQIKSPFDDLEI